MSKEYAVYKGEELLAIGTKEECAKELGVSPEYIYWLTMPTAKRRLASRKNPAKCITAVILDEDDYHMNCEEKFELFKASVSPHKTENSLG